MANRSYLYATNTIPDTGIKPENLELVGISEWNYNIPIVAKLLLSGTPRASQSVVWAGSDLVALVGDYAVGVEKLEKFLHQISLPIAQPLIAQALGFLGQAENQRRYFLLECSELFAMGDEPIHKQNLGLLENINNLDAELENALVGLMPKPIKEPKGALAKFLNTKLSAAFKSGLDPLQPFYDLGLGHWSNVLYFDLDHDDNDDEE